MSDRPVPETGERESVAVYRALDPHPNCAHRWGNITTVLTPTAFGAYARAFQRCAFCGGVQDA